MALADKVKRDNHMPVVLRDYQLKLKADIYDLWNRGARNVLAVSPTGSGKTNLKGAIFAEFDQPAVAIAHRQELVSQISQAMAAMGVVHRLIAPKSLIQFCITQHVKKFGKSFYNPQSTVAVAGVDTLIRRVDDLIQWCNQVKLWDIDEAHHVLRDNKWGKGVGIFPNAIGLGLTATPIRCDRKSLGSSRSGVFDAMAIGPTMRHLVERGFLSDYIIYGPPPSIDLSKVHVSETTGEFIPSELRDAAHKSTITGDIVEHYLKIAPGRRGITFVVDVEIANQTAAAFNARGVPALSVSAKTPDHLRVAAIEKFERGEILQLVNVDLFGEGMDVPAVEVVSAGRPTESFSLFAQQFGRMMRPIYAAGFDLSTDAARLAAIATGPKPRGIYIDHVGNVVRHGGPPDQDRQWVLNDVEPGRKRKADPDVIPVRKCKGCFQDHSAMYKACPFCGFVEQPSSRGAPEFVDGDLHEYSPELMARLFGERRRIMREPQIPLGATDIVEASIRKNWRLRQEANVALEESIALWAGIQREVHQRDDSTSYRLFYHSFGVDVATALTLDRPKAEKLTQMIRDTFT